MASGISATPEQVSSLFAEFDTDHDGRLSMEELQALCTAVGVFVDAEGAGRVFAAIDADSDGRISPLELYNFLNTRRHEVEAGADVHLRAALIARYAAHAGASLVRRVSSSESSTMVGTTAESSKLDFHLRIGDGSSPAEFPGGMALSVDLGMAAAAPAPPAELPSGKGVVLCLSTAPGADKAAVVNAIADMLRPMEAMPLPPGVSAPRVCIIGDAVAIVVDAPILDVPPPLAAMFGVGDIEEAFAGLHYEFTTFLNMSLTELMECDEAPAETLRAEVHWSLNIPRHLLDMIERIGQAISESPMAAVLPPQVMMLLSTYSLMFSIIDRVSAEYRVHSVAGLIHKYANIMMLAGRMVPGADAGESPLRTMVDTVRAAASSNLRDHKSTIMPQMARNLRRAMDGMPPEQTANVRTLISSVNGILAFNVWAGPLAYSIETKNATTSWPAEALAYMDSHAAIADEE